MRPDADSTTTPTNEGTMDIREWQREIHALAVEKGWYPNGDQRPASELAPVIVANLHGEVSEAWEEYRKGHPLDHIYFREDGKPEGFPVELADLVIRVLDTCDAIGIDLARVIRMKHNFNKTRPHRHGGKMA